ncbi:MAG: MBL fold metallo-hydrolase [candidate division Zixibacteria bacterium]|nr:MBL fold metallo-hydrolase [Candidatus Tariuqbacter arcticus]
MKITIWGCRGSIPTPGESTIKYGGNTTCIALYPDDNDNKPIIIDAGTGIRLLGNQLSSIRNPLELNILFTHTHWDHIQGFPFFAPANNSQNTITIYGHSETGKGLKNRILAQMDQRNFPISYESLKAKIKFSEIAGDFILNGTGIQILELNHPGSGMGFRFSKDDKSFVFITDHELSDKPYIGGDYRHTLEFCRGADLLIHDAQYLASEYPNYKGWGHSTIENACEMALEAAVGEFFFFHHDPDRTDNEIDNIESDLQESAQCKSITCLAAREGMVIEI